MNSTERRAGWLTTAIAEGDHDAARELLADTGLKALRDLCLHFAQRCVTLPERTNAISEILELTAPRFGVTTFDVLSGSRRGEVTDARSTVCYIAMLLGIGYSATGRGLGRDHSTVMHACSRVGQTPRLRAIATEVAETLGWDREDSA